MRSLRGSPDPLAFNLVQAWFAPVVGLALLPWLDLATLPRSLLFCAVLSGIAHAAYFYWMSRAFERGDMSLVYPIARSSPPTPGVNESPRAIPN